jgi:hypothetical protein
MIAEAAGDAGASGAFELKSPLSRGLDSAPAPFSAAAIAASAAASGDAEFSAADVELEDEIGRGNFGVVYRAK